MAIADSGIGIAPENLHQIMEPLYSTKARGLGLGLAMSRSIVEKNQGTLQAASELGRGSVFTVRLTASTDDGGGNMTRRGTSRILVVDDDRDICRNLSDILTDLGYEVDFAHDGPSALELVRQRPYDVALLDCKMPGMDGLTLYREIKKQRAGTVSLLVTAYASPTTADEALAAGAWKVAAKPVDFPRAAELRGRGARASRWCWSSTTTTTSAPTSGTCSASAASGSAWPTTRAKRPTSSRDAIQRRSHRHENPGR